MVQLLVPGTEAKGTSDRLSEESAAALVNIAELASYTSKHAPSNTVSLWIQDKKCEGMEFQAGDSVRVKTKGDSPFICKYKPCLLTVDQLHIHDEINSIFTYSILS